MPVPKILIVDDDRQSRELLREVLEANGYKVGDVHDGKAARKELGHEGEYRIVIADLRMPGESGIELLRHLRQQDSRYSVVLMSSFISEAEKQMAQELGVDALLEKPFRLSEFLQVVSELAGRGSIRVST